MKKGEESDDDSELEEELEVTAWLDEADEPVVDERIIMSKNEVLFYFNIGGNQLVPGCPPILF